MESTGRGDRVVPNQYFKSMSL